MSTTFTPPPPTGTEPPKYNTPRDRALRRVAVGLGVVLVFFVGMGCGSSSSGNESSATPAPTATVTETAESTPTLPASCRKAISMGTALAANTDELLDFIGSGKFITDADGSQAKSLGERIGKTRAEYRLARDACLSETNGGA